MSWSKWFLFVNGKDFLKIINWFFNDLVLRKSDGSSIKWTIFPSLFPNNFWLFWINGITIIFINKNEKNINELILDMHFINVNNWYEKIFLSYIRFNFYHYIRFFNKIHRVNFMHQIFKNKIFPNFILILIFYTNSRLLKT